MPVVLQRALPDIGETIGGKYRLTRRVGEGGMGVVFEAEHIRIHQRVAIKMLLPEVIDVPDVVSRFEREGRAAGRLRGDNVTRVLDVDITDKGIPYLVMEFLDGVDLGHLIDERKQLPVAEAVDYVLQACTAMVEAHAAGIIHRDLKPANLFLCGEKVKVLDFGISKVESDGEARVTATQTIVGTPLYMSPEQIRSAKHVDTRTDIWALGIILYEFLTGKTPFEGSTMGAAVAICVDEPPPLANFRPDVPTALEDAIMTALAKDPTKRFPNVESLAAAISQFGSGRVVTDLSSPSIRIPQRPPSGREMANARTIDIREGAATSPGWTTRAGAKGTRSKLVLLGSAVGAAAAVAIVGIFIVTKVQSKPEQQAPAAPSTIIREVMVAPPASSAAPMETAVAVPVLSSTVRAGAPVRGGPKPTATPSKTPPPPPPPQTTTVPDRNPVHL